MGREGRIKCPSLPHFFILKRAFWFEFGIIAMQPKSGFFNAKGYNFVVGICFARPLDIASWNDRSSLTKS